MIISWILGGLGNQMFQYAAGRALSLATRQSHLLDLQDFQGYRLHQGHEIDRVFHAPVTPATAADVKKLLGWRAGSLARRFLWRMRSPVLNGKNLAMEPYASFWPGLRAVHSPRYLMGYWQSERYFKDFEPEIRADFRFRGELAGSDFEIASRIGRCQSVSVHVRRGDYLTDVKTTRIFKVCSLEYYHQAVAHIAEKMSSPYFFVFSDDLQWAAANLRIPFPVEYVRGNQGAQSHVDMRLMSMCKHQIIANSSFSWWGAWLNEDPDKIVIAPRHWFSNGMDDRDLTPPQWIRL